MLKNAQQHNEYSEQYYAFSFVHSYTDEPFTSTLPESLFNASRYLVNVIGKTEAPFGISKAKTLYTLAKHGELLGAYKLARYAYEQLEHLRVSDNWIDQIEFAMMTLQTKPFNDKEELLPIDYYSSSTNPLVNTTGSGDICINSGHPFTRSFVTFENLPLVEFQPEVT